MTIYVDHAKQLSNEPVETTGHIVVEIRGWNVYVRIQQAAPEGQVTRLDLGGVRLDRPPGSTRETCLAAGLHAARALLLSGEVRLE